MSSTSFHESDLVQAIGRLSIVKLLGYRDFIAYITSLGVSLMKLNDFDDMLYINCGSYSSTYRTIHKTSGKLVAFKTSLSSLSRADQQLEKEAHHRALSGIIQEIRILAHPSLSTHPNLPRILGVSLVEDSQQDGISPCIIQELAFTDLESYLATDKAKPELDKLRMILDIADGICALHAYRLVHGDIHFKNILLFHDQGYIRAKVADLGTCGPESASEFIPGTRSFWAPECHPKSKFHKTHMNGSARDVYTFGLLVNGLISGPYRDSPFPPDQQFVVQHDQDRTLQELERWRVNEFLHRNSDDDTTRAQLVTMVSQIVRVDPSERPAISTLCRDLRVIFKEDNVQEIAEETIQKALISDPEDPRVRTVNQLSLPPGVVSRLTSEFRVASRETKDPKIAVYMATLYAGVIGSGVQRPWNVVAKTQWLFKATELGFYPALSSLVVDKDVVRITKEFGKELLCYKHPSYEPPSIDYPELIRQLILFAAMPDGSASRLLTSLSEPTPDPRDKTIEMANRVVSAQRSRIKRLLPNLFLFERFTLHRTFDAGPIDSDASDLAILGKKSDLETYAYSNALENFIAAASASSYTQSHGNVWMQMAIYGGALNVAEYISQFYGVKADHEHEGMSHVELSILFKRLDILSMFLKSGAVIRPAEGNRPSGLHLASRQDNKEMICMLCEHLQATGALQSVLESSTSSGGLAHWTPTYTAMACHAYTNVLTFLDFGADPNTASKDGHHLIHLAVQPQCPAPPMFVLKRLIEASADLNAANEKYQAPLHTAIGSTNVLAVYYLLTADADCDVLSEAGENALQAAEDITRSMQMEGQMETMNEEGEICESGHDHCCRASEYIVSMVGIATAGGKESLRQVVDGVEEHLKNKVWIVDRIPTNFYVQIEVPVI